MLTQKSLTGREYAHDLFLIWSLLGRPTESMIAHNNTIPISSVIEGTATLFYFIGILQKASRHATGPNECQVSNVHDGDDLEERIVPHMKLRCITYMS